MKYFLYLLLYLSFASSTVCFGQAVSKVDSLQTVLITQNGITKIETLDVLAWILRKKKPLLAKEYAEQALELSKEIGYHKGEAIALNRLGVIVKELDRFEDAKTYLLHSLKIAKKHTIEYSIARAYNELGRLYVSQNNNVEAVTFFLNSYDSFLFLGNKKAAAKAATNLGNSYTSFEAFENALLYYTKGVELRKEVNDSLGLARSYRDLGTFNKYLNNYEEMLQYSEKAYEIFKKIKRYKDAYKAKVSIGNAYNLLKQNKKSKETYSEALQLIAPYEINDPSVLYHSLATLYREIGNQDSAFYYYDKGIEIFKSEGDKKRLSYSYNNVGNLFLDLNDYENSLSYLNQSLALQKELKDSSIIDETYKSFANHFEKRGDFKKAFLYKDSSTTIRERKNKKIKASGRFELAYINTKRKSENAENTIVIKALESTQKSTVINGLIILFIILSILFFVFFRAKKLKQEKKITELAYQQHKIEAELAKEKQQQKLEEMLQEQERKAISKMIDGQEEERERIANDLHDRLGTMLSVVKIHYKSVEDNLEKIQKETRFQYEKANELLDKACEAVREIAHNMVSGTLTKFGLMPALNELKQTIEVTKKLQIELVGYGLDDRLNNKTEIQLYRIIQELLNNVLKHAQATEVTIQLLKKDDRMNIMVIDNGIGFEVNEVLLKEGMGIRSIRARVKEMNGDFTIDSGMGNGTTINIDIPL